MRQRVMGSSGLHVSELALGTWAFGGDWGPVKTSESIATIREALTQGINLFDTADIYGQGRSETLLGRALKGVDRRSFHILTKGGRDFYSTGCAASDRSVLRNTTPEYLQDALQRSLNRLGMEYVDIYLLHDPPVDSYRRDDLFATLVEAREKGLIYLIGAALHTPEEADELLSRHAVDLLEFPLSILDDRGWEIVSRTAGCRIGALCRSPLARGTLTGSLRNTRRFPPSDHRSARWTREELARRAETSSELAHIAKQHKLNASGSQVAIRFLLDDNRVSSVVMGVKNRTQLRENVMASQQANLPGGVKTDLEQLRAHYRGDN